MWSANIYQRSARYSNSISDYLDPVGLLGRRPAQGFLEHGCEASSVLSPTQSGNSKCSDNVGKAERLTGSGTSVPPNLYKQ